MADISREIRIAFEGDDRISKAIQSVGSGFNQLTNQVNAATKPMADLAGNILLVEGALAALAAGALVYAYQKSIQFESAVVELRKVLGDQADVLDEAQQKALYRWQLDWPSLEKGYEGRAETRRGVDVIHFKDGMNIKKLTYSKTVIAIDGKRVRLSGQSPEM